MRRTLATVAILASTLSLAACGDEETPATSGAGSSPSASTGATTDAPSSGTPSTGTSDGGSDSGAKVIAVTFSGDSVTPSGERIDVAVGQPIELDVTAEEAGEIHVHSTPEQELEYAAGSTTLKLTIDTPGVVDVESHDLDQVIVQLEVR